ncbi:MAG: uracil-DNA glycosylase [Proteobacteria bacterium]|nr:uracil-DNA glycosylase [Pseudomonadota bacterium]
MTNRPDLTPELLEALAWQLELGADEAIGETPLDRFAESAAAESTGPARAPIVTTPAVRRGPGRATGATADAPPGPEGPRAAKGESAGEPAGESPRDLARGAATLEELAEAMRGFEGSPLKKSARSFVFCDGLAGARLMVIGEAPGGEEDRIGKPFVGRAGQLLDRMLAAIGLARTAPAPEDAAYITNILPWRPPGNRTPTPDEVALFLPFIERHIELAKPDFILSVGNTPTKTLLGTATGIKRMRGRWVRHGASGLPLLPSFHPAYLLRQPADKRLAWRDLLSLRAALDGEGPKLE